MTEKLSVQVGRNIRKSRVAMRLSQEDLALRCGLHRTYVGSVERGERNLTLDTLQKIAVALGLTPIDLLASEEDCV